MTKEYLKYEELNNRINDDYLISKIIDEFKDIMNYIRFVNRTK